MGLVSWFRFHLVSCCSIILRYNHFILIVTDCLFSCFILGNQILMKPLIAFIEVVFFQFSLLCTVQIYLKFRTFYFLLHCKTCLHFFVIHKFSMKLLCRGQIKGRCWSNYWPKWRTSLLYKCCRYSFVSLLEKEFIFKGVTGDFRNPIANLWNLAGARRLVTMHQDIRDLEICAMLSVHFKAFGGTGIMTSESRLVYLKILRTMIGMWYLISDTIKQFCVPYECW